MSRIEAIVWHRNRKPSVVRIKPRQSHFTLNDKEYHIDPDCAVFGTYIVPMTAGLWKKDCNRYYFLENFPKPINPYKMMEKPQFIKEGSPENIPDHSLCIEPAEMAQIFKPRFYQIISRVKDPKQELMFFLALGTGALTLYVAWKVSQMTGLLTQIADWVSRQTGAV